MNKSPKANRSSGELEFTVLVRTEVLAGSTIWLANCLELDLVVQAHSEDQLRDRLGRTLVETVVLAAHKGALPFWGAPIKDHMVQELLDKTLKRTRTYSTPSIPGHALPPSADLGVGLERWVNGSTIVEVRPIHQNAA